MLLYPQGDPRNSLPEGGRETELVREAYRRIRYASEKSRKPAEWWTDMVSHTEGLAVGMLTEEEWRREIRLADSNRQSWLREHGYRTSEAA